MLTLSVPEEPPVTVQSGSISVLGRVGRTTSLSQYFSESGDYHAVYPAGSLVCPGNKEDILQMSSVSYRTSIGTEPSGPVSLLRVRVMRAHARVCLWVWCVVVFLLLLTM